ncbi:hypothetical protein AMTRI_Chr11g156750 [Amborella trichopoda]
MAAMNSSVLACNYGVSGAVSATEANWKPLISSAASPVSGSPSGSKVMSVRAQASAVSLDKEEKCAGGRRAAMLCLAAALFATTTVAATDANAGVIDDYLEKSKLNKRLATSGANFARAYTVEFGTCKFPENFTGCHDLAKQKKVPFLTDDLQLECEGKDKFKCGSNVFWKW